MMGNIVEGGFSWMWIIPMILVMIAFLGVVAWGIARIVHPGYQLGHGRRNYVHGTTQEQITPPTSEDAEEILTRRFAEGKIDYDEFQRRLDVIKQHRGMTSS